MQGATRPCYILAGDFNAPPGWPTHQMISDTGRPNEKSLNILREPQIQLDDGEVGIWLYVYSKSVCSTMVSVLIIYII